VNESCTAENCQTQKRGRNEIITAAKILLTNQMVLIVSGGCTQRTRFCLNSLKFDSVCVSNRQFRVILTSVWPLARLLI